MPSRYLIGIDLGTTNSVVAYIDTQDVADGGSAIRVFPVPQLVGQEEVRTLHILPSFLYFPTADELSAGAVSATWDEDPPMVTGVLAREQGALVPSRQVSSAKSWLSYPGVDRRARILPAQAEPPQPMISPVEASARYLMHLRDAWNDAMRIDAETSFEHQEIVLTVPASFDEDARELTVEAARKAGLDKLTLLEEPLAAFYAWIASNRYAQVDGPSSSPYRARGEKGEDLLDGDLILICDIGGGTTDFSLVRARLVNGELEFERTAIGEHLLLGGDNLDFALARRVEEKLKVELTLHQRYALRRACCASKERLLSDSSLARVPVTVLGSGRAVVGQALSVDLTREDVLQILTAGFLPITPPDEMPAHGRPTGLRELGLPYASDPAITRHLAAFLTQAAVAMKSSSANHRMARPDVVLFNGGFFAPAVTRERIVEAISAWFDGPQSGWRPRLLNNEAVDSAVARGAACYGRVRRGTGLRIRAGNARTYYVGLPSNDGLQGICVLPAEVEEGTTLPLLNREFSVLANRPVSFSLYSSRTRRDAHGEIASLDEADVHRHAPLVTLLRYGKKLREIYLIVRIRARFTEVGTLELWCESRDTPHRWRLQFELRGEEAQEQQLNTAKPQPMPTRSSVITTSDAAVETAVRLVRDVFGGSAEGDILAPEALASQMEAALGAKRDSWPVSAIRRFGEVLIEVAARRKKSPRHEVRWLNLSGFCLRPGFGVPGDDAHVNALRTIASNELVFADDLQCQVELLVLLRRISGGINAREQQGLYRKYASRAGRKKKGWVNRQLKYEEWRLLASLEHLLGSTRALLGNELVAKIRKEPENAIWLWSLGRLGARIPLYGPLHSVVVPEIAGEWLKVLLDLPTFTAATGSAIVMIARRTDDRSRDIDDAIREPAISRLMVLGIDEETIQLLSKYVPPERADAVRSFGESLPFGLQVVSSSNCLLSVPALHSSGLSFSNPAESQVACEGSQSGTAPKSDMDVG
ncbi:hsp70 family protein [Edaphobacter aggregans]|uniref:hsp70 family protein n=1 Tax=Edaphobacter aggregans TaxID=570835 RepID=UPI000ABAD67B|nr:hsp70 family protein [Edaphobacter aggregans]